MRESCCGRGGPEHNGAACRRDCKAEELIRMRKIITVLIHQIRLNSALQGYIQSLYRFVDRNQLYRLLFIRSV